MDVRFVVQKEVGHQSFYVNGRDGLRLHGRAFFPAQDTTAAAAGAPPSADVVIVPGYAEHAGRYREFAHYLVGLGLVVWAYDPRGHGMSEGPRGFVREFSDYIDDMDAILALRDVTKPFVMLGHSHGGLITLRWLDERGQNISLLQGVILSNPFLALSQPVTGVKRFVADRAAKYMPRLSLPNGIASEKLSHDAAIVEAHKRDPLVFGVANSGWFAELEIAQERARNMSVLQVPLFYIYSDADEVVDWRASERLSAQLDAPEKRVILRKDDYHEVLNEVGRQDLYETVGAWVKERLRS